MFKYRNALIRQNEDAHGFACRLIEYLLAAARGDDPVFVASQIQILVEKSTRKVAPTAFGLLQSFVLLCMTGLVLVVGCLVACVLVVLSADTRSTCSVNAKDP